MQFMDADIMVCEVNDSVVCEDPPAQAYFRIIGGS